MGRDRLRPGNPFSTIERALGCRKLKHHFKPISTSCNLPSDRKFERRKTDTFAPITGTSHRQASKIGARRLYDRCGNGFICMSSFVRPPPPPAWRPSFRPPSGNCFRASALSVLSFRQRQLRMRNPGARASCRMPGPMVTPAPPPYLVRSL